jgi:DNA-binding transcriptional ArsR family regulator
LIDEMKDGAGSCGEHPRRELPLPAPQPVALARAAAVFRALGDVPRLRLLTLLSRGAACVSELAEAENEPISSVSQRLKVLHGERLVARRRHGKHIEYSLADQHVVELLFNTLAHVTEEPARPMPTVPDAVDSETSPVSKPKRSNTP